VSELQDDYLAAAEAIQIHFQRPTMLRLPFSSRVVDPKPHPAEGMKEFAPFGFEGFVRFRLDSTGHLTDDRLDVATGSPDVVESIVAAVKRADSANAFSPPSPEVRRERGVILLRFVEMGRATVPGVALLRLIVPAIVADSGPELIKMSQISYPTRLRQAGISERVVLQFVVNADGRIEPSSLDLLRASHREFATEAVKAMRDARFRPARIGNCAVPALVLVPIDFKVRR
jgi:TonB family protein